MVKSNLIIYSASFEDSFEQVKISNKHADQLHR